ncbi:MAG: NAD-dependent succinate-semialdehyde dehydrogenase [Desulfosalsimonadaceae bacterium]
MLELRDASLFREQAFISGRWVDADTERRFDVGNPATGKRIGSVPDMGRGEVAGAIDAAEAALFMWREETAKARANFLRRWHDLMMENREDLARLMTAEQGKPLVESRGEIAYAAAFIEWFAEEAKRIYGDVIPSPMAESRILTIKVPVGVCAAITPWNFPAAMIARKAAAALAAGCSMVVKPASQTPFSALAMAELARRSGIPGGVFNVVTGDSKTIGKELTENPTIRKLSFTGSTEVGKILIQQSAPTVKRLSLELGGHAPFIVFPDAGLDAAVSGAMASKYRNSGQTCVCANRFYVHEDIYDEFVSRLTGSVKRLRVAEGFAEGAQQGPLIDMDAVEKVEAQISDALQKGGELLCGGSRHALGGTFFEPTVIAEATPDMRIAGEETFGPVAPVFRFREETEVIGMANSTDFGLAAYFYTRDVGRIWRVAEALEFGIIGINTGLISTEAAPFGGMKQSGFGREGSRYGIDEYLEIKYLNMAGLDG